MSGRSHPATLPGGAELTGRDVLGPTLGRPERELGTPATQRVSFLAYSFWSLGQQPGLLLLALLMPV